MTTNHRRLYSLLDRALIGALLLLVALLIGVSAARAGEIIPSVGMTRSVDGDDEAKLYGGLAFRGNLIPLLKTEVGVAYRQDTYFDGDLTVHQWPVTASLWLNPVPAIYAGGGVGWYQTSLDYRDELGLESDTSQEFGVHVGGGLSIPIAPAFGLDLNGRYVFMRDQESQLIPERFDPDFWSTTLGLAFKF